MLLVRQRGLLEHAWSLSCVCVLVLAGCVDLTGTCPLAGLASRSLRVRASPSRLPARPGLPLLPLLLPVAHD